ncbi:alpha/beta hydrolase [Methylobacterium sp. J-076]|uniref:alpha/beta hydrolase n=1 Tax=Methylobacterium sp. J-076 TaxID=2836655 RepID=UPI001FB8F769|nr:alpha/beta hydrolase [Methylobacterium sp. J-076]MCJ2015488.1 alpha/beta hydrolase [Methylobacterium sp. J-076]
MTLALAESAFTGGTPISSTPVTFGGMLGWYGAGRSRRGVVLCGTLGYEQISAGRGWRRLADDLTAAGHPTLRFDYPGEGDSADPDTADVDGLVRAIGSAARFLRGEGGAEEIVLVGLRLGATLAALAAGEGGVDRLVLLAPFASGRAYLREMTIRTKTIDQLPDGRPFPQDPAAPVFGGFRPAPGLLASLATLDLAKVPPAPVPKVLLLGPDPSGLAGRLRDGGSAVETGPFPGLAPFLSNALISETPREVFAQVLGFVADDASARPGTPMPAPPAGPIAHSSWTETLVRFGGNAGIVCTPRVSDPTMPSVLFLNSGVNPRSGYGRQTTDLARGLAAMGVRSLRMDLRGVGDSEDRADGSLPLYALDALAEARAGIDRLDDGRGVVVTGNCSGAFLGFHAVCADSRVRAGILSNLYCFDWDPKADLAAALKPSFRSPAAYASLLRRPDAWRRVLRGEVKVGAIASRLAALAGGRLRHAAATLLRPFPAPDSVAGRVAAIRKRGARLVLVFSAGEAGLGEVAAHLGRSPAKVARRLGHPLVILPDTDHNLSTAGAQERMREILVATLAAAAAGQSPGHRRSAGE